MNIKPFHDRDQARYWGVGYVVPASDGTSWWSLGGRSTPSGHELYSAGLDDHGRPTSAEGWPPDVRGRYIWSKGDTGSYTVHEVAS